jgi:hypothetical protein
MQHAIHTHAPSYVYHIIMCSYVSRVLNAPCCRSVFVVNSLHSAALLLQARDAMSASGHILSSVEQRIDGVASEINSLLAAHSNVAEVREVHGLTETLDSVFAIFEQADLVYYQTFPPWMVGVHRSNRSGNGLIPKDVHDLLLLLSGPSGWSWSEVSHATATELAPNAEGKTDEAFNHALVASSNGYLAKFAPGDIKILSLACGHTTACLHACGKPGTRSMHAELAGEDGCLSLAKLRERSRAMAVAVEKGIRWRVIRWQVAAKWPALLKLSQKALNFREKFARQETEWQCCLEIHSEMVDHPAADIKDIAQRVASCNPALSHQIKDMAAFVKQWSGGVEKSLLLEVDEFIKQQSIKRKVKGPVFAAFAKAPLGQVATYVTACFKLLYGSPTAGEGGESTIITSSDVAAMGGRLKPQVIQATEIMMRAREILAECTELAALERTKVLGNLDMMLVSHVHNKSKAYPSLVAIANNFWTELCHLCAPTARKPTEWGASEPKPTVVASALAETSSGVIVANSAKFVVNSLATRKVDDLEFTITKMADDIAHLQGQDGEELQISTAKLFDDFSSPTKARQEVLMRAAQIPSNSLGNAGLARERLLLLAPCIPNHRMTCTVF